MSREGSEIDGTKGHMVSGAAGKLDSMDSGQWLWDGILFTRFGRAKLVADDLYPELRYAKKDVVKLLPNGDGPYCEFAVPDLPSTSGVYVFFVRGELRYIGKAENLKRRFYHYGHISPKNCYVGGRSTNIRLNKLVREAIRAGVEVEIFIHKTADFSALEERMIAALQPPWNRRGIKLKT